VKLRARTLGGIDEFSISNKTRLVFEISVGANGEQALNFLDFTPPRCPEERFLVFL